MLRLNIKLHPYCVYDFTGQFNGRFSNVRTAAHTVTEMGRKAYGRIEAMIEGQVIELNFNECYELHQRTQSRY